MSQVIQNVPVAIYGTKLRIRVLYSKPCIDVGLGGELPWKLCYRQMRSVNERAARSLRAGNLDDKTNVADDTR
jgi:hypothetical protein